MFDRVFTALTAAVTRLLEWALVGLLGLMVVLVFGNVVLRYGFNSGIAVSEELARLLFIWLVFLGAVLASREHAHLGMDTVVRRLPRAGKKAALLLSGSLMLICCGIFWLGSWRQTQVNLDNTYPVLGISYGWLYGVGLVFSVGMIISIAYNLYDAFTRPHTDDELVLVRDSEEHAEEELHLLGEAGRK